ncbi:MAG: sigma-70 family RNA polymerase sigma factor [Pseudomonadota bacterium]
MIKKPQSSRSLSEFPTITDHNFETLYRTHFTSLCANIRKSFGAGPPEPEDVVQTAFMKFAGLSNRSGVHDPRAFIYTIARNLVLDHKRASKAADAYIAEQIALDQSMTLEGISPERLIASKEEFRVLIAAMRKLPRKQQIILMMSRLEGKSYKQIGQETGWSSGDISRNMAMGLSTLLQALKYPDDQETKSHKS